MRHIKSFGRLVNYPQAQFTLGLGFEILGALFTMDLASQRIATLFLFCAFSGAIKDIIDNILYLWQIARRYIV